MATRPGEVRINITGNADKLKKATSDATTNLNKFSTDTEGKLGKIGASFSNLGRNIGIGLAAIGAGAVVLGAKAITSASDLGETISKTKVLFGDAADEVIKFSETTARTLGQSKRDALDAADTFAIFGKAAGLTGTDLSGFSTELVTLSSDMSSFFNTSPQDAAAAIGSALRGEYEPIRRYGVLIDDASLKTEALELGIYDGNGALTAQQKTLAVNALIYKKTKDAQGDFARTSDGLANQQRILTATFEDVKAKLGTALLPIMTAVTSYIIDDFIPAFKEFWETHGPAIKEVLGKIVDKAKDVAKWLGEKVPAGLKKLGNFAKDNKPLIFGLAAAIGALAIALLAYKIQVIALQIPLAITAALSLITFSAAAWVVIGIVAAVAVLIGVLVYLYFRFKVVRTVVDAVGRTFATVFKAIVKVAGVAIKWIVEKFKDFSKSVSGVIRSLTAAWDKWWKKNGAAVMEAFGHIKNVIMIAFGVIKKIVETYIAIYAAIFRTMFAVLKPVIQYVIDIFQTLMPIIKAVWEVIWGYISFYIQLIKDIFMVVVNLINGDFGKAWQSLKDLVGNAWNGIFDIIKSVIDLILAAIRGVVNQTIAMFNLLIRGANLIPGINIPLIPTWEAAGGNAPKAVEEGKTSPSMPFRHSGGTVPGAKGTSTVMNLAAGEVVLTAAQAARMNMGGGHTFNINVSGSNANAADIAREIAWQMKTQGR